MDDNEQNSWRSIILESKSSFHSKAAKQKVIIETSLSKIGEQVVINEVDRSVVKHERLITNNNSERIKGSILDHSIISHDHHHHNHTHQKHDHVCDI